MKSRKLFYSNYLDYYWNKSTFVIIFKNKLFIVFCPFCLLALAAVPLLKKETIAAALIGLNQSVDHFLVVGTQNDVFQDWTDSVPAVYKGT